MKTPKIEIKGQTATGKSSLAYAIKAALSEYGIKCEITGCEDEEIGEMDKSWKNRIACLKGQTIKIKTIQTKRGNKT